MAYVTSHPRTGNAWIGLYDDLINGWRWSLDNSSFYGGGERQFRNWNATQPINFHDQQHCVVLMTGRANFGTWGNVNCTIRFPFICYNGEFSFSVKMDFKKKWKFSVLIKQCLYFQFSLLFHWSWNQKKEKVMTLTVNHQYLSRFSKWNRILCQNKSKV